MKTRNIAFVILLIGFVYSCKRQYEALPAQTIASVTVVNAIPNSEPIIPVFGTSDPLHYFVGAQTVSYGNSQLYSRISGGNPLYVVQQTDTSNIGGKSDLLFNGALKLEGSNIYSFFLAGDTAKTDTLFVRDEIPFYNDSSVGVRFVNLSSNSSAISINVLGLPSSQGGVNNLAYRNISSFTKFSAGSNASPDRSYVFEIRNQANDSLLLTYTWYFTFQKCNTLVISGLEGDGTPTPLNVFQVNNY